MSPRDDSLMIASKGLNSTNAKRNLQDENPVIRESCSLDQVECSMCGDIGLREELFRCTKCHFRLQHTYCSHSYPKKRSYAGVCNWCDRDDGLIHVPRTAEVCQASVANESPKAPRWNNELEMLLEAAAIALEKEHKAERFSNSLGPLSGCKFSGRKRRKMLRTKSYPGKKEIVKAMTEGNDISECKDKKSPTSTLSKRMGRRYKYILDVY